MCAKDTSTTTTCSQFGILCGVLFKIHTYHLSTWVPLKRKPDCHCSPLQKQKPGVTLTQGVLFWWQLCVFEWQRRTCTRTKVTFTVPSAFKHKYVANMWKDVTEHVTEGSLMLSLHFPWHCVLVWYLKCESVLRSRNEYKHCERKH